MINAAFTVETFLEGTRTDLDRLSAYFRKGEFLLAEDASGQLIGSIYTELRPLRGYLGMLAVAPAHQRAGHGRTLMLAGEEHLRGKGCVAVDICVIAWRTELPPIYRSFGYVETAIEDFQPSQKPQARRPPLPLHHHVQAPLRNPCTSSPGAPGASLLGTWESRVPHLRRGFIAAKVGFTGAPGASLLGTWESRVPHLRRGFIAARPGSPANLFAGVERGLSFVGCPIHARSLRMSGMKVSS